MFNLTSTVHSIVHKTVDLSETMGSQCIPSSPLVSSLGHKISDLLSELLRVAYQELQLFLAITVFGVCVFLYKFPLPTPSFTMKRDWQDHNWQDRNWQSRNRQNSDWQNNDWQDRSVIPLPLVTEDQPVTPDCKSSNKQCDLQSAFDETAFDENILDNCTLDESSLEGGTPRNSPGSSFYSSAFSRSPPDDSTLIEDDAVSINISEASIKQCRRACFTIFREIKVDPQSPGFFTPRSEISKVSKSGTSIHKNLNTESSLNNDPFANFDSGCSFYDDTVVQTDPIAETNNNNNNNNNFSPERFLYVFHQMKYSEFICQFEAVFLVFLKILIENESTTFKRQWNQLRVHKSLHCKMKTPMKTTEALRMLNSSDKPQFIVNMLKFMIWFELQSREYRSKHAGRVSTYKVNHNLSFQRVHKYVKLIGQLKTISESSRTSLLRFSQQVLTHESFPRTYQKLTS